MKVFISACIAGVFAFAGKNKLIAFKLFEKDPDIIAKKLKLFGSGKRISELEEIEPELSNYEIKIEPEFEYLKNNFRSIAIEKKFVKDDSELNKLISQVAIIQTKQKISVSEKRDKLIVQSVSALNDLDKILNLMTERLREWYGLHYPELKISDHEKFAEQISEIGKRENFPDFEKSMGISLGEEDIEIMREYAVNLKKTYELKKNLEKYLNKVVPEEMPNTNALLGPILAARLLSHAGSLQKLAKMTSSTIQTIGAEKSMFRFLKERKRGKKNARPPRFGILFCHPAISSAPREKQSKVARLLSSKLTIAVRADFYSKEDRSKELKEDFDKKLKKILKYS